MGAKVDYQVTLEDIHPAFWPFEVAQPELREIYKYSHYQCNLIIQVLRKDTMTRDYKLDNLKTLIE